MEGVYRQSLVFGYPYTLQTGLGADGTRQVAFADVLLPPKPTGRRTACVLARAHDMKM